MLTGAGLNALVYSLLNIAACSRDDWASAYTIGTAGTLAGIGALREIRELTERRKQSPAYLLWKLKSDSGTSADHEVDDGRLGLPPNVIAEKVERIF
jgi:hypothetical protein